MKTLQFFILVLLASTFAGCATVAPPKTKDLDSVAQRKSEQAGALDSIAADNASKDSANNDLQTQQAEFLEQAKKDLIDSDKRVADAQAELVNQAELKAVKEKADAEYQLQQAAIAQGQKDLIESEKQAADAFAELATLVSLKEEERGLVLTLSGSILFRSAESTLLPSALVKLDQVTKVLQAIHARILIVEGHTDSQGLMTYNQGLSQRRADAVRDYLVQKGYPADQIQSLGLGEGRPIGNNASAEGRVNNRRVEIIIKREQIKRQ